MKRYDLITNYRCGSSIEEMEQADDGEWVRYEDVEPIGMQTNCPSCASLIAQDLGPHPACPRCKGTGEESNAQFRCPCRWSTSPLRPSTSLPEPPQ